MKKAWQKRGCLLQLQLSPKPGTLLTALLLLIFKGLPHLLESARVIHFHLGFFLDASLLHLLPAPQQSGLLLITFWVMCHAGWKSSEQDSADSKAPPLKGYQQHALPCHTYQGYCTCNTGLEACHQTAHVVAATCVHIHQRYAITWAGQSLPGNLYLGSLTGSGYGGCRGGILVTHVGLRGLRVSTSAVSPLHQCGLATLLQQPLLHCYILAQPLLHVAEPQLFLSYQGLQSHMLQLQTRLWRTRVEEGF